jgi:hypothetical protein
MKWHTNTNQLIAFRSESGMTEFCCYDFTSALISATPGWKPNFISEVPVSVPVNLWPTFYSSRIGYSLRVPYWLLVAFTGFLTSAPWLNCRFGLRTLLIATTLVAAVLGLIVWLSR